MFHSRLSKKRGFTLIEVMMGASIMAIVSAALVGAFVGQAALNLTARNLTAAMTDATRVLEEIRKQNGSVVCTQGIPSIKPPSNRTSWDEWLTAIGKTMTLDKATTFETVAVTCQDANAIVCVPQTNVLCPDGVTTVTCPQVGQLTVCGPNGPTVSPVTAPYCGNRSAFNTPAQIGSGEWKSQNVATSYDPLRITVAVGWVERDRVIGSPDFYYQGETTSAGGFKSPPVTTPAQLAIRESGDDGIVTSQAMLSTIVTCR